MTPKGLHEIMYICMCIQAKKPYKTKDYLRNDSVC